MLEPVIETLPILKSQRQYPLRRKFSENTWHDISILIFRQLAELLKEAGLPDGVLNVVHGDKEAVDAILAHPDIKAVGFANPQAFLAQVPKLEPGCVILDIRMPGMSGWELVKLIRQRKSEQKIIMLTGSYAEDDIRAAFASGVDGYLLKPVRAALLYRLIDNVINDVPLEQQFISTSWTGE